MLPFTQIVGLERAQQALLLLAVNPALKGVAIAATVGSGKSTLARAFAELLPASTPFVELPLNITEDRLLGGLDLEATLATGRRVVEPGLLARAHGGVLYVDGLNLLDRTVVTHLVEALSSNVVRVERDGLSAVHPSEFMLIATFDPSDGDVSPSLLDRLALFVPLTPSAVAAARAEVVRRNLWPAEADDEVAMLRSLIQVARQALPHVRISDEQVQALLHTALSLGVEGNRADIFAVEAALAAAALEGRTQVDDSDLRLAAQLVLVPRATRSPHEQLQAATHERAPQPPPTPSDGDETQRDGQADEPRLPEEMLLEAVKTELPPDLLGLPFALQRKSRASGRRGVALNARRGRFVRAVEGDLRCGRIALLPTLLAAAPWQRLRQTECPHHNGRIQVRRGDLRVKRFRDRAGMLYVFVVDASGSMAINRMREAKGAAIRLLQDAYVHRDHVALIAFRGRAAQVLLPVAQSVERAKRELDVLPTGGGTPLASALLAALQIIRQARSRGIAQATLVLMTDGRANVGIAAADRQTLREEVRRLAQLIVAERINSVVIDTQVNYLSRSEAAELATWLGGRYVYLPNAKADQIAQKAMSISSAIRR